MNLGSEPEPELDGVEEEWDDGKINEVSVTVKHDTSPHNKKTFIFEIVDGEAALERMDMSKGPAWTWSEQEIKSMPDALKLAKQTAEERSELDEVLDGN